MSRTKKHKDHLNEVLQDPELAAEYINVAAEEEDAKYLLVAIRNVVDAQGGMTWLAKETGLNRESLYTTLSENGNPTLDGLDRILKALGVRLRVAPILAPRVVSGGRAKATSEPVKDKVKRQKI